MVSRDYTREVGLESAERRVPKGVAIVVFAVIAAGVWFGIHSLAGAPRHEPAPAAEHHA